MANKYSPDAEYFARSLRDLESELATRDDAYYRDRAEGEVRKFEARVAGPIDEESFAGVFGAVPTRDEIEAAEAPLRDVALVARRLRDSDARQLKEARDRAGYYAALEMGLAASESGRGA